MKQESKVEPVADGGGLQGWESLSLAAQRAGGDKWTYDGQMFILAADGQIVAEPRGFGRGMDINIAEFISAASPENILKLLAAHASSQEALREMTANYNTLLDEVVRLNGLSPERSS